MRILMLEDDELISMMLKKLLEQRNYQVTICNNCKEFYEKKLSWYDLYIIDISLPDGSGMDICRKIRECMNRPILILTALADEEQVVHAFDIGVDDYVIKPFRSRELVARIEAMARRSQRGEDDCKDEKEGLIIDTKDQSVRWEGQILKFTNIEYQLLRELVHSSGKRVSREVLLNYICRNKGEYVEDNTLSVYISRLRRKLKSYGVIDGIETCWGGGYRWNSDDKNIRIQ